MASVPTCSTSSGWPTSAIASTTSKPHPSRRGRGWRPNHALFPEALCDRVLWDYEPIDPWRLAFITGVGPREVRVDDAVVYADGAPTRVDAAEIRAKAAEAAQRLFARLET